MENGENILSKETHSHLNLIIEEIKIKIIKGQIHIKMV